MRFSINKQSLLDVVANVAGGISNNTVQPILAGIKISTAETKIVLQSTDLNLSIKQSVACLVEEEGATVLPGKLLLNILKTLPDEALVIATAGNQAVIECASSKFKIQTFNADDFPTFPTIEAEQELIIPFDEFKKMYRKVAIAVNHEENLDGALKGVLLKSDGAKFSMTTTDTCRIALSSVDINGGQAFEAIVESSFLNNVVSAVGEDAENVNLGLNQNQVVITLGDITFISRRIEGKFPPYEKMLFNGASSKIECDKETFKQCAKRAKVLSSTTLKMVLDIQPENKVCKLSANTDAGVIKDVIQLNENSTGENCKIALNCKFLLDALGVIDSENVVLETKNATTPGILKPADEAEKYTYAVMPITL